MALKSLADIMEEAQRRMVKRLRRKKKGVRPRAKKQRPSVIAVLARKRSATTEHRESPKKEGAPKTPVYPCDECGDDLIDLGERDVLKCMLHGDKSRTTVLERAAANGDTNATAELQMLADLDAAYPPPKGGK